MPKQRNEISFGERNGAGLGMRGKNINKSDTMNPGREIKRANSFSLSSEELIAKGNPRDVEIQVKPTNLDDDMDLDTSAEDWPLLANQVVGHEDF